MACQRNVQQKSNNFYTSKFFSFVSFIILFIRTQFQPTIIEHFPKLFQFLMKNFFLFLFSPSRHTQEFKLIQELLISLPDILKCLNVQEKVFDDVLNAVIWLLDKNQPNALQMHCCNLLKKCADFDICSVYVKLLKYYQMDRYKINCKKILPNQF